MVDWDDFDSATYVAQNYGREILPEDRQIMDFVVSELRNLRMPSNGIRMAADIGAGPNLYPGLLLAPYVNSSGALELIEYSAANRRYLRKSFEGADGNALAVWLRFERHLQQLGHSASIQKLRTVAKVRAGSVYDLPVDRYEAITCFFVLESITADVDLVAAGLDSVMRSLKPGGLFVTAHMVGSTGYEVRPGQSYPACDLTMPEIEKSYEPYGTFRSILTSPSPQQAVRAGYHGMAALVGRRRS
ncbi:hypothetical protein RKE30_33950 [Streptomyces sp. Li-HN-5-11]|uniref:hypothetical protein n=1 Tax=Streptomyces sp. Li-HN-5-11 TaxID=3075432 RepID=UPI0028A82FAB|nr:hypothetical protein [Streptomyces sp. Li-HN-5-11]WNM35021.1 hypothetical protein RKE30_33950 [Streptomyces sp. Li-HN-5-11]